MATIHRNITSSPPSTWPRRRLAVSIAGGGGGVALGLMGAGSGGVVESGCCCGGRGGSLSSATSGQEAARGWRRAERRGEERRGVERCRRRKVAEGRRGGDAGVNTPVISVKCTWAQLARRYYCSYAEPYGLEISGDFAFFFGNALQKRRWMDEYEGGIVYYCIIGRDCFDLGDENVIGDRCTTVESNFVKATFESYFKNPILQFQ